MRTRDVIRISRPELYQMVWSIPMTRLAKEYGLSDVGLAKICKKYRIPRPSRGYWAKKEAGENVKTTPLPPGLDEEVIQIRPSSYHSSFPEPQTGLEPLIKAEITPEMLVLVPEALRNPHPLVHRSAEMLRSLEPNQWGILEPKKNCLDIKVSKKTLSRALRIMDALIKALEERGHKVSLTEKSTAVMLSGVSLGFGISERLETKRKEREHRLEGYYDFGHSKFDLEKVPSGDLCLTIEAPSGKVYRRNWKDAEGKPLEGQLNSFIIGLIKAAISKRLYIKQREEEQRERLERERIMEEQRRAHAERVQKVKEERGRVEKLVSDSEKWFKGNLIRQFIYAVESAQEEGDCPFKPEGDLREWLKWARDQADRLDPLKPSPSSVLDEKIEEEEEREHSFHRQYSGMNDGASQNRR